MDPNIYKNPTQWDPSRYLPGREEDKSEGGLGYLGWGAGRHPCLGMRVSTFLLSLFSLSRI